MKIRAIFVGDLVVADGVGPRLAVVGLGPIDPDVATVFPEPIGGVFADDVGLFARSGVVFPFDVEVRRDRDRYTTVSLLFAPPVNSFCEPGA